MTSGTIQTTDTTNPTFASVTESADPLEAGQVEIITIYGVADASGIQTVQISIEGGPYYVTMNNIGGSTWLYSTWALSTEGNYSYMISIQDNTDHWTTVNGTIEVKKAAESPIPAFALPLMILGLAIVGGWFILKRRTLF